MPERKPAKPKTTVDRQIPGAFRGRDRHAAALHDRQRPTRRRRSRRRRSCCPALGFALGPVFEEKDQPWQSVGKHRRLQRATPTSRARSPSSRRSATSARSTVFVRKYNPAVDTEKRDEYNAYIAISTACMHLGCPVNFVAGGAALHLPVPRRRVRLRRQGRRRPAGAPAGPLLHARGGRRRASSGPASRSTASWSASHRAIRVSRSTASASTCTRRVPRCGRSRGPEMRQASRTPAPEAHAAGARSGPGKTYGPQTPVEHGADAATSRASAGSTSARRSRASAAG